MMMSGFHSYAEVQFIVYALLVQIRTLNHTFGAASDFTRQRRWHGFDHR